MILYESSEDYLERILMLKEKNGEVISIDIANSMGYTKASVSRAVKNLKENDYITVDSKGRIELTDKGNEVALKMLNRHRIFKSFFMKCGVSEEIAERDACKIEHDISDETYNAIINYIIEDEKKLNKK